MKCSRCGHDNEDDFFRFAIMKNVYTDVISLEIFCKYHVSHLEYYLAGAATIFSEYKVIKELTYNQYLKYSPLE